MIGSCCSFTSFARRIAQPGVSQKQWWAERNESVEVSERPVGHEEVNPFVESEPAGEEVAHGYLVGCRDLKFEAVETNRPSRFFDMEQDGWQV